MRGIVSFPFFSSDHKESVPLVLIPESPSSRQDSCISNNANRMPYPTRKEYPCAFARFLKHPERMVVSEGPEWSTIVHTTSRQASTASCCAGELKPISAVS
jgi:hypothetical protein